MSGWRHRVYKRPVVKDSLPVIDAAAAAWRRTLVGWVGLAGRRALWVVLAAGVLTAATGVYVAENFRIDTSVTDMLSPDLPFRERSRAVSEAFPQFSDNIAVVIDGDTPDLADDGAASLAALMRERPDLYGGVHDPAGDPYFRRNGLLYLDEGELSDLGDRLAEAQPYLGKLWRDPSLGGLGDMLGLAIDEILKDASQPPPIELDTVLGAMAEVAEAQARGQFRHLSWRDLMTGADGGKRRILLIQPALDFGSLRPAEKAMESIRRLAAEAGLDPGHGLRVRLTGSAALATEELQSVEDGMGLAAVLSLALVIGLLFAGLALRAPGPIRPHHPGHGAGLDRRLRLRRHRAAEPDLGGLRGPVHRIERRFRHSLRAPLRRRDRPGPGSPPGAGRGRRGRRRGADAGGRGGGHRFLFLLGHGLPWG